VSEKPDSPQVKKLSTKRRTPNQFGDRPNGAVDMSASSGNSANPARDNRRAIGVLAALTWTASGARIGLNALRHPQQLDRSVGV
jgi:hypothetical protein